MDIFEQIARRIIHEQELIIGPLAWDEARKISGLSINETTKEITLSGNKGDLLNQLVSQYERLFGKASREVSREAAAELSRQLPASQVPASLK